MRRNWCRGNYLRTTLYFRGTKSASLEPQNSIPIVTSGSEASSLFSVSKLRAGPLFDGQDNYVARRPATFTFLTHVAKIPRHISKSQKGQRRTIYLSTNTMTWHSATHITWVYTENVLSWLEFIFLLEERWNIRRIWVSIVNSLRFLCSSRLLLQRVTWCSYGYDLLVGDNEFVCR